MQYTVCVECMLIQWPCFHHSSFNIAYNLSRLHLPSAPSLPHLLLLLVVGDSATMRRAAKYLCLDEQKMPSKYFLKSSRVDRPTRCVYVVFTPFLQKSVQWKFCRMKIFSSKWCFRHVLTVLCFCFFFSHNFFAFVLLYTTYIFVDVCAIRNSFSFFLMKCNGEHKCTMNKRTINGINCKYGTHLECIFCSWWATTFCFTLRRIIWMICKPYVITAFESHEKFSCVCT